MPARVLAFLLAIVMAAGLATPAAAASPDVMVQVDDGAVEPDPVITELPVVVVVPARRELRKILIPMAELHGRLHRAWVFRPPR